MKIVNRSCLAQQMTEKIAVKVDTKNCFWKTWLGSVSYYTLVALNLMEILE